MINILFFNNEKMSKKRFSQLKKYNFCDLEHFKLLKTCQVLVVAIKSAPQKYRLVSRNFTRFTCKKIVATFFNAFITGPVIFYKLNTKTGHPKSLTSKDVKIIKQNTVVWNRFRKSDNVV